MLRSPSPSALTGGQPRRPPRHFAPAGQTAPAKL